MDKLNNIGLVVEAGKFNRESKASERREMLETLLKEIHVHETAGASLVCYAHVLTSMVRSVRVQAHTELVGDGDTSCLHS